MARHHHRTLILLIASYIILVATWSMQTADAQNFNVVNNVPNSAGGSRFDNEVVDDYAQQTLISASSFIWTTFQQDNPSDRKDVQQITLFVDSMSGVAYTAGNEIHLSAEYVEQFSGDVKTEITGVLYHEMTHVWQWNGNGQANGGLIEGIADYVRLKAGLGPSHWVQPGQGDRWDQGYDVTARFLDYCDSLSSGFVAQLNAKMKDSYNDGFFSDLLGKPVDQLWTDYKANFGQ